jgi:hypothetical protein
MQYPFRQAFHDYGPAKGPRLGITWHMAEGGGTVRYLGRDNPNGVSVHFVVERSGLVIQMLRLDHANGSIRPTAIRTTDDAPFDQGGVPVVYGSTAAGEVLGVWHFDPNSATIGVEIEGFAKDGPTASQQAAMAELWTDLHERFPGIRSLAHRDFADYKACPGKKIPWDRLGGHGLERGAAIVNSYPVPKVPTIGTVAKGVVLYTTDAMAPDDPGRIIVDPSRDLPYLGAPSSKVRIVEYVTEMGVHSGKAYFVPVDDLTSIRAVPVPAPPADTSPYDELDIAAARVEGERAGIEKGTDAERARLRALLGL